MTPEERRAHARTYYQRHKAAVQARHKRVLQRLTDNVLKAREASQQRLHKPYVAIGPGQVHLEGPAVFSVSQLREMVMLAEALQL